MNYNVCYIVYFVILYFSSKYFGGAIPPTFTLGGIAPSPPARHHCSLMNASSRINTSFRINPLKVRKFNKRPGRLFVKKYNILRWLSPNRLTYERGDAQC